jgi:hypothetical protein
MNIISKRLATMALLLIFSAVIIFHLFVLTGFVPIDLVWGGRLKDQQQMVSFEIVSIILNVLMLMVIAGYAGYVNVRVNPKIFKVALWVMFILFLLNTIGNLFSENQWEQLIFTPITVLISIFCLRLAID